MSRIQLKTWGQFSEIVDFKRIGVTCIVKIIVYKENQLNVW